MRAALVLALFLLVAKIGETQPDTRDTLMVGVKSSPPFIITSEVGYSGLSIDLWEQLASRLGRSFAYKEYDLEQLITAVETGKVDIAISPLTVTSERLQRFHFSQPFYITHLAIATQKKRESSWRAFLINFFSWQFFTALGLLIVVIMAFGILAWLFERRKNPDQFSPGIRGLWEGLWWSAVTMTTVGYGDKAPKSVGGRVVALVWMFTAIIIISGFTASIASALTVQNLGDDISNLSDLKDKHVGTVSGSSSAAFLGSNGIAFQGVSTPEAGLELLHNRELEAFVYDKPILQYIIQNQTYGESLKVLPHQFVRQYYAFSFPPGSTLPDELNPLLLDIIEGISWKAMMGKYNLLE